MDITATRVQMAARISAAEFELLKDSQAARDREIDQTGWSGEGSNGPSAGDMFGEMV